jgi:hypothetical protein
MHARFLSSSMVVVVASAVLAQAALAGGEPKNEPPFTRSVAVRTAQSAVPSASSPARVAAEAKNELPFTRRIVASPVDPVTSGEPKNELPFTTAVTVVGDASGSGFSWLDATLGVVLGICTTLAALGVTLLARHRVPRTA